MKLLRHIRAFFTAEDGAVTVDWVVLTAVIIGLALAVLAAVSSGVNDLSGDIESTLKAQTIATY